MEDIINEKCKKISNFFLILALLGPVIQTSSYAVIPKLKKSEVQLNKHYKSTNRSTNFNTAEEYEKFALKFWKKAKQKPTITNWKNAEYFCLKASQLFSASGNTKKASHLAVNAVKAQANASLVFSAINPDSQNWLSSAHLLLEAHKACLAENDIVGIETSEVLYQVSNANADTETALYAWQSALETPSYYSWINAEALLDQAAKACLNVRHAIYRNKYQEKATKLQIMSLQAHNFAIEFFK